MRKVYLIVHKSYRYGDLEGTRELKFLDKEVRDEYFKLWMQKQKENSDLEILEETDTWFSQTNDKWHYDTYKQDVEEVYCESFEVKNGKIVLTFSDGEKTHPHF